MSKILIREAASEEILGLRARELRAGKPEDAARFPEDHDPGTYHFAAFATDRLIGCLTLIRTDSSPQPSWQLRGMATDSGWRHKGVGRSLLVHAEARIRDLAAAQPDAIGARIWCNARTTAVAFYERMGYRTLSGEFMIEKVGPHYKMEKIIL